MARARGHQAVVTSGATWRSNCHQGRRQRRGHGQTVIRGDDSDVDRSNCDVRIRDVEARQRLLDSLLSQSPVRPVSMGVRRIGNNNKLISFTLSCRHRFRATKGISFIHNIVIEYIGYIEHVTFTLSCKHRIRGHEGRIIHTLHNHRIYKIK